MSDFIERQTLERFRQEKKWGEQNHHDGTWQMILMEELGEVSKAVLNGDYEKAMKEIVEVAAVAQAYYESKERSKICLCGICRDTKSKSSEKEKVG